MRRAAPLLALAAALAVPTSSTAMDDSGPVVSMQYVAYQPAAITALAGETVTWHNESVRAHTVIADDGSFGSGAIFAGSMFTHRFDAPGRWLYHCNIHPTMRGEVDVHRVLLDAPARSVAPGEAYTLGGRAALPAGSAVTIEGDPGGGFAPAATATVGDDGRFAATVHPATSTAYRVVADGDESPHVLLTVLDRKVRAAAARHGRAVVVGARVVPAARGQRVVLQLHLPERFGWWPVRSKRLDAHSRARFVVRTRRRVRARVVLTRPDGVTPLASSAPVLVRAD